MKTLAGRVADPLGHAWMRELVQGPHRPELRFNTWSIPPSEYRTVQAPRIGVDYCHDGDEFGEVIHLERSDGRGLWAVAVVPDTIRPALAVKVGEETRSVPVPLFFSAKTASTQDHRDIQLVSLGLTPSPAQVNAQPVRFLDGDITAYGGVHSRWNLPLGYERDLLGRANDARTARHAHEPVVIHDLDPQQRPSGLELASSRR